MHSLDGGGIQLCSEHKDSDNLLSKEVQVRVNICIHVSMHDAVSMCVCMKIYIKMCMSVFVCE